MSELLLAVNGTMKRIGRFGHPASPADDWAYATPVAKVAISRTAVRRLI